jgi:hypothetical protein
MMSIQINELIQEQHNIFNKKYTIKIKEAYQYYIQEELKEIFDNYTNNLMYDTIIYEQDLFIISCMFEREYLDLCQNKKYKMNWIAFNHVIINLCNL